MPSGLCEHVMDKIDEVIQKLESSVTENVETNPPLAIKSEALFESTNDPDAYEADQPPKKKPKSSESQEVNEIAEESKTQPLDLRTGEHSEAKMPNCSVVIPKLE